MNKRITSLLLAVVILASMICIGISADEVMKTSDEAIAILKAEEGFSSTPYWDYAQWTVGYGTRCPDDMLEYYKQYGIKEEEAELLLRDFLTQFESELYKFMNRTGVKLTQNQFDALLLFTYNCGSGWSYDTNGTFYNAIVSGATGNDLIYAFSRWCSAGGQILTALLRRRLCEANLYLNGVYSQAAPDNYGYVLYDACGGKTSPTVQGYDTALTAEILSVPTWEEYTFAGWYTAETGGTEVKVLDETVKNKRLYAHWLDADGNDVSASIRGIQVTVNTDGLNIRSGAGTEYERVGTANKGDLFVITETVENGSYTWGKFSAGWICLAYTDYEQVLQEQQKPEDDKDQSGEDNTEQPPENKDEQTPENKDDQTPENDQDPLPEDDKNDAADNTQQTPPTEPAPDPTPEPEPEPAPAPKTQMGTVKVSDRLRIRSGPSTGYAVTGYLQNGDRVEILEQQIIGAMVWGKVANGWISLSYVTLDPTEPEKVPTDTTEVVATGTVKVNDFLRIRSGPGTSYAQVAYLINGAKVEILETKKSESMTWGKISNGWISLDYVVLDKKEEDPPKTVTGTVKVNDFLRIRSGAGTSYAIAGYLGKDAKVEILEQKTVGGTVWGKIEKGWISLDYVVLDGQTTAPTTVTKTVTADCLRIRSGAGTSNTIVGYLYAGAKVEILETKLADGVQWGRTAKGWISMEYVK